MSSVNMYELDFERPLMQLERQISELEVQNQQEQSVVGGEGDVDLGAEIGELRASHEMMLEKIYANLSPVNTVKVARHPNRPQAMDYIKAFVKDFCELHGDRHYGDDRAIVCGFGRIGKTKCVVIGHNKGKDTAEKIKCNFGCAHPEGYRKALRVMKLGEKYGLPIVTLIDTPGAYPGIGAEERGQAEAIAVNLREMSRLKVPIVSVVIGEGGSGGALGIGVGDRIAMMEYSWWSVISPEGCASILWKTSNPETNAQAAEVLHLTAKDNLELGVVDDLIKEPMGGAHRDLNRATANVEKYLLGALRDLNRFKTNNLLNKRYKRLRSMGRTTG
ncbi:Acetyl-coenzyme A carboxylase carboxyl transferase subunit alpha [Poriferisphaera corsica]|uniref:Acetyl-coenzyme A carboxylase carboxyl transferase subunit alpha n=1 Tax=Poriferisphaera corsica TaxID=2528020 RepID=A0A517YTR8_9BACT|nr:acetyl-CoA carboxylase carboxyltransferase subunit alpha [Poriferisphaera corsica]QDU33623.1 Acetyl-coenzyme A carboxylase carboxyl transferase subunit alpha [Poriferisphaera corsica]